MCEATLASRHVFERFVDGVVESGHIFVEVYLCQNRRRPLKVGFGCLCASLSSGSARVLTFVGALRLSNEVKA